jgi:hypothetical protein
VKARANTVNCRYKRRRHASASSWPFHVPFILHTSIGAQVGLVLFYFAAQVGGFAGVNEFRERGTACI